MPVRVLLVVCVLGACVGCNHTKAPPAKQPATQPTVALKSGLGAVHHPVSTKDPFAQAYFDQGLAYVYGFNHDEAVKSFKQAAELDPNLAMAWWGVALALGPNINKDVDPADEKAAFDALQKAISLSEHASPAEQAYISALARRYTDDPKEDPKKMAMDYKLSMGDLARQYPNDLDAATLYAESAMDLRPWKLWTPDGKPAEGTEEIVVTLEGVLARDPNHLGANHYYIHAVEASPQPQRAMPSAQRLPKLAPASGHLVHMPAHIYMRTGDYQSAIRANEQAASVDEKYISCCGPKGIYPAMYYSHNLHFLAVAAAMSGQSKVANDAAKQLAKNVEPHLAQMPMVAGFLVFPILIEVRFGQWDEILATPMPDVSLPPIEAAMQFARGMAFAAKGNLPDAGAAQAAFAAAAAKCGDEVMGNNTARAIMQIATHVLAAKIAEAKRDMPAAIEHWKLAVQAQDELAYDEPPAWPWPVRENLGAALLRSGAPAQAEAVFRRDLELNPNNPRSLLGLAAALRAQAKDEEAQQIQAQAERALRDADVAIRVEDM